MGILRYMKEEFQVIKERDPAIKSPMEVSYYKKRIIRLLETK